MKQTTPSKFALAVAAATLLMAAGSATRASASDAIPQTYTYYFTANSGQPTELNGSTITIENFENGSFSVLGFDFIDTPLSGSPFTSASYTSGGAYITSADSTTWAGVFDVHGLTGNTSQAASATGHSLGFFPTDETSANGVWNAAVPGVPDVSDTLYLLLGSLSALGGAARSIRARNTVRL